MDKQQQAILARDIIRMVHDYSDNADVLEYLDSFAFAIARMLEKQSIVDWDGIASVCDQRSYSMKHSKSAAPLDKRFLDECGRKLQRYLPAETH